MLLNKLSDTSKVDLRILFWYPEGLLKSDWTKLLTFAIARCHGGDSEVEELDRSTLCPISKIYMRYRNYLMVQEGKGPYWWQNISWLPQREGRKWAFGGGTLQ